MVKLTWKDKLRKLVGLGVTDETAMAIAKEESDKRQKAIAAEKARLEAAAAAKKAEEEKASAAKKPAAKKAPAKKKKAPVDRDGDGLVYDGTPKQRPTPKKKTTTAKKKSSKK